MVVPKSFPALCTPYVQVVHQPWKCTVHKVLEMLAQMECPRSVQVLQEMLCIQEYRSSVSKSVLHNSCVITVSKKCPSWALSKLGPNLTHAQDTSCGCGLVFSRFWRSPATRFSSLCGDLNELRDRLSYIQNKCSPTMTFRILFNN